MSSSTKLVIPEFAEQISGVSLSTIKSYLSPELLSQIKSIEMFDSVDSTNTYLLNRIDQQDKEGFYVCIAEEQTAGRGRRDKQWVSPKGNLYLSISCPLSKEIKKTPLSMMVGEAVMKVLASLSDVQDITLKYPNDILWQGKKLAGILIETKGNRAVIGIGVNVNMPKNEVKIDQPWVDLNMISYGSVELSLLAAQIIKLAVKNM